MVEYGMQEVVQVTQYVYTLYRGFKRQKLYISHYPSIYIYIFISSISSAEAAFSQVEKASVLIVIGQMEHPSVFGERTGGSALEGGYSWGLLGWCLFCFRRWMHFFLGGMTMVW